MIRAIEMRDEDAWRRLFRAYGRFYETELTDAVLEKVWALLLQRDSGIDGLVSELDGTVVGFAHYRCHPATFTGGYDRYLDDLFVSLEARGAGHATALIEHLAALAGSGGTLRWVTAADNAQAQRVYDRIATRTTWVTYEKQL